AQVLSITTTARGDVFVAGSYEGTPDFGGGRLPFRNLAGAFLAGPGPGGEPRYNKALGTPGHTSSVTSGAAPGHARLLAGSFDGSIDLGEGSMRSSGLTDIFVARISP